MVRIELQLRQAQSGAVEPIERCLSRFYYERDSRGLFPPGTTIDECIDRKHPACRFDTFSAGDSVASGKGWSRERQLREECGSNYLTRCGLGVTFSPQRHRRNGSIHTGGSAAMGPTATRRTARWVVRTRRRRRGCSRRPLVTLINMQLSAHWTG